MQRTFVTFRVGVAFLCATLAYADDTIPSGSLLPRTHDGAIAGSVSMPGIAGVGEATKDSVVRQGGPTRVLSRNDSLLDSIIAAIDSGDTTTPLGVRADAAVPPGSGRLVDGIRAGFHGLARDTQSFLHRQYGTVAVVGAGVVAFLLLLIGVARRRSKKEERRFMTTTRLSLMNGEVQRACLYIEKHYANPGLTPASVCGAIVTGVSFLETMFERELGMGVAAYIDQVRIHHARQIAQWNPAADTAFIAAHVGYATAEEFERHFKQVMGSDFAAYRQEQQRSAGEQA